MILQALQDDDPLLGESRQLLPETDDYAQATVEDMVCKACADGYTRHHALVSTNVPHRREGRQRLVSKEDESSIDWNKHLGLLDAELMRTLDEFQLVQWKRGAFETPSWFQPARTAGVQG